MDSGLSGCHDTTLAAVLASLGAFDGEPWPPYTSHIALELFRKASSQTPQVSKAGQSDTSAASTIKAPAKKSWFASIFGGPTSTGSNLPEELARKKLDELSEADKSKLDGHFVRIRYNDKVMIVPGCKAEGKHLDGDESFCTLVSLAGSCSCRDANMVQEAFKSVVDKFTPTHWKQACQSNLDVPAIPQKIQPAGY